MLKQTILTANKNYLELDAYFHKNAVQTILLVCDGAFPLFEISKYFNALSGRTGIQVVTFDDFKPNPLYESVVKGVEVFRRNKCDLIVAIGGGSAMDVAKCIKLFSRMDAAQNYLTQPILPNEVKLLAMPTTAGTGSEATRYAVIYFNGEKQSIADDSCIPTAVLMDASVLKTLPIYQKKSTMMDALCHAVESYWSVNSTTESRNYSQQAIKMILENELTYLANEELGNANMLRASHIAGKAINITQTTAGHAMCYKLTSLFGIAHGHAAALCVDRLWPYMIAHLDQCSDPRGETYLENLMVELAQLFGAQDAAEGAQRFHQLLQALQLPTPQGQDDAQLELLARSVNPVRLKNNPVNLSEEGLYKMYQEILCLR